MSPDFARAAKEERFVSALADRPAEPPALQVQRCWSAGSCAEWTHAQVPCAEQIISANHVMGNAVGPFEHVRGVVANHVELLAWLQTSWNLHHLQSHRRHQADVIPSHGVRRHRHAQLYHRAGTRSALGACVVLVLKGKPAQHAVHDGSRTVAGCGSEQCIAVELMDDVRDELIGQLAKEAPTRE